MPSEDQHIKSNTSSVSSSNNRPVSASHDDGEEGQHSSSPSVDNNKVGRFLVTPLTSVGSNHPASANISIFVDTTDEMGRIRRINSGQDLRLRDGKNRSASRGCWPHHPHPTCSTIGGNDDQSAAEMREGPPYCEEEDLGDLGFFVGSPPTNWQQRRRRRSTLSSSRTPDNNDSSTSDDVEDDIHNASSSFEEFSFYVNRSPGSVSSHEGGGGGGERRGRFFLTPYEPEAQS